MGEITRNHYYTVDLNKPLMRQNCGILLAEGDGAANEFIFTLQRDGVDVVPYQSMLVTAYFIRQDGSTVLLEGSNSGKTVRVVLQDACYSYAGRFALAVKVTTTDVTTTIALLDGIIKNTSTESFVDPAETIVSFEDILNGAGGGGGGSGGFYTPVVEQTGTATMRVNYMPSKTGMPAVAPVNVTLPQGPAGSNGDPGKTPVKGTDYWTADDQENIMQQVNAESLAYISTELAKRGQLKLEFANSIEECTDTSKLYVLPDGYIYAYMTVGGYTNQVPLSVGKDGTVFNGVGYQDNHRLVYTTCGDTTEELANHVATGYIPMVHTDTIRMSGVTWAKTNKCCIAFFDENFIPIGYYIGNGYVGGAPTSVTGANKTISCMADKTLQSVAVADGVSTFTITFLDADKETSTIINYSGEHVKYVRIGAEGSGANMVVTINEEIAGSQPEGEYAWSNTGNAFVPADYEDRIIQLENENAEMKERLDELCNTAGTNGAMYTFKDKKVMFFGDSITRNEASYISKLLDSTGMIRIANFAIDGAKLRNKGETVMDGNPSFEQNNTVPNQVQKLLNNIADYESPDIIIVSAGTNDDSAESEYDESKYTDDSGAYVDLSTITLTNFSGAMRWIYEKLMECYPEAKIFFATPIQANYGSRTFAKTRTKAECIRQNCERLSTPCIDAFRKSGIYGRYEASSANGKYLKDGLHPNAAGAVVLAKCYHREMANALID